MGGHGQKKRVSLWFSLLKHSTIPNSDSYQQEDIHINMPIRGNTMNWGCHLGQFVIGAKPLAVVGVREKGSQIAVGSVFYLSVIS